MAKIIYYATSLTGGGAGALDGLVDGDELADLDGAIVITLNYALFYSLDADSGVAESSPTIIAPDLNPGDKRWILTGISEVSAAAMDELKNIGVTAISAAQWGYLGALTTDPIGGDGTAGRILRVTSIHIEDGTNANTLKCTLVNQWNGDVIAVTDNIAKGATTGHFTLSADGIDLRVEAAGLSGNCLSAVPNLYVNASTVVLMCSAGVSANDITMYFRNAATNALQDTTVLVDTGDLWVQIFYITDA